MLKTILGEIEITVNSQIIEYLPIQLDNQEDNFSVDGRYKIIVGLEDIIEEEHEDIIIKIRLKKNLDNIKECVESGQRLAMLSFYSDNKKVSIGVEDELTGVLCTYEKDSVKVLILPDAKISRVIFGVAWISWSDYERQEVYTWFAADPTIYKAYENLKKKEL